jgi:hypothetical protein
VPFREVDRLVVERGSDRKDHRTGFRGEVHVAQMDATERRFAHTQQQRSAFLERNIDNFRIADSSGVDDDKAVSGLIQWVGMQEKGRRFAAAAF